MERHDNQELNDTLRKLGLAKAWIKDPVTKKSGPAAISMRRKIWKSSSKYTGAMLRAIRAKRAK